MIYENSVSDLCDCRNFLFKKKKKNVEDLIKQVKFSVPLCLNDSNLFSKSTSRGHYGGRIL